MARSERIYAQQHQRKKKFPPDRIPFRPQAVAEDVLDMTAYIEHDITLDELCAKIAWNNFLEREYKGGKIPEDVMMKFLMSIGWVR
jgi:hypothetical protein